MQEPYQQTGYNAGPPQGGTRAVGNPSAYGPGGGYETPGGAGKAEPPPIEKRPYLGQPFDTNQNPPRSY